MPSSANGTNLKMLRTAFHQHPMPDISLVDLRHAEVWFAMAHAMHPGVAANW